MIRARWARKLPMRWTSLMKIAIDVVGGAQDGESVAVAVHNVEKRSLGALCSGIWRTIVSAIKK